MKIVAILCLLVGYVAAAHWDHMTGSASNGDHIPLDVSLDQSSMMTVSHKPANTVTNFRETTNLYVFARNLVAIRDSVDMRCYVQRSYVTYEELKKEMDTSKATSKSELSNTEEETINPKALSCRPLSPSSVDFLFGGKVAAFCLHHNTYFLNEEDFVLMSKAPGHVIRNKRQTVTVEVESKGKGTVTVTVKVKK